jgi:5-methylthioadenosine/S-adenosylhomocysteine deaminase
LRGEQQMHLAGQADQPAFVGSLAGRALLVDMAKFGHAALLDAYHHLITKWHGAADFRLWAAVSCSAPQRVSQPYLDDLPSISGSHDLPFYAHMLETKLQRVFGGERLGGRSLVRYAADLGMLTARLNIIHALFLVVILTVFMATNS